jgi:acyl transferase domain-containing protein
VIDECSALLQAELGLDIRTVLYPEPSRRDEAAELLARTYITQPAIFIVSYATARVFLDLGLQPELLIGHSVGEYVAAVVADVMTLEEALLAVAFRGRLIYALPRGSMLAVLKSEADLAGILPDTLDIAVINSPELVVVSGPDEAIADFAAGMAQQKVFTKLLPTSHAFHSRMMAPSLDAYRERFRRVTLRAPRIPIISTVTGKPMSLEQATDHEYWVQHVVDPVRFAAAAQEALRRDSLVLVECGPGHSLESAVRRQLPAQTPHAVISTLREGVDALTAIDTALAKLWIEEHSVDFARHFGSERCRKVPFPLLPFARTRYSIDFSANASVDAAEKNPRRPDPAAWYSQPAWRRTPAVAHVPRLERAPVDADPYWLVFVADALGEQLAATLRARG